MRRRRRKGLEHVAMYFRQSADRRQQSQFLEYWSDPDIGHLYRVMLLGPAAPNDRGSGEDVNCVCRVGTNRGMAWEGASIAVQSISESSYRIASFFTTHKTPSSAPTASSAPPCASPARSIYAPRPYTRPQTPDPTSPSAPPTHLSSAR